MIRITVALGKPLFSLSLSLPLWKCMQGSKSIQAWAFNSLSFESHIGQEYLGKSPSHSPFHPVTQEAVSSLGVYMTTALATDPTPAGPLLSEVNIHS